MAGKNIILAGVGGQGLVLTTQIISEAAFNAGYEVKTNDVIGLSQRGGTIWGSVKFAEKVHSPNIAPKSADILVAFEALEARRWRHMLKESDSVAVVNTYQMAPTLVQQEQEEYADDIFEKVSEHSKLIKVDATAIASDMGNVAVANIFLVGIAARHIDIDRQIWYKAIENNVPPKFTQLNINAFDKGYSFEE